MILITRHFPNIPNIFWIICIYSTCKTFRQLLSWSSELVFFYFFCASCPTAQQKKLEWDMLQSVPVLEGLGQTGHDPIEPYAYNSFCTFWYLVSEMAFDCKVTKLLYTLYIYHLNYFNTSFMPMHNLNLPNKLWCSMILTV